MVNNDRVVRLSSGRISFLQPSTRWGGECFRLFQFDHRGVVCFFYSDDAGATWSESKPSHSFPGLPALSGLQEPGIVERSDGSLWAFCRTDMGRQYELFSCDRGESWTLPSPSLYLPMLASFHKAPSDERHFLQSGTRASLQVPLASGGRRCTGRNPSRLCIEQGRGSSWSDMRILENDDDRGTAILRFTSSTMQFSLPTVQGRRMWTRISLQDSGFGESR